MPKIAYQSLVVHVLVLFNVLVALIAVNVAPLGITNPWLLLVVIPFAIAAGTYAANQMKSIGAGTPGTVETKTVDVKLTPPPAPPQ
ncbi:MAG TPA: hypothetical protein VGS01_09525 [Candidatus Limnocylindria bacterium]|jgi:hypothetical protein|nr:hypothetical protein [Candidatus Limnocylindria bacterium]